MYHFPLFPSIVPLVRFVSADGILLLIMMHRIFCFFDRFEDRVRHVLSRHPVLYAFVAGVAIVLFWRGVWMFADELWFMTPLVSIAVSVVVMLLSGTFVWFFVGDQILVSGLREEKRIDEKTEEEVLHEEEDMQCLAREVTAMRNDIADLKRALVSKRRMNPARKSKTELS